MQSWRNSQSGVGAVVGVCVRVVGVGDVWEHHEEAGDEEEYSDSEKRNGHPLPVQLAQRARVNRRVHSV